MLVTELGIEMLVRPVQFRNASFSMLVIELGIVILVRPVQFLYLQLFVCQIFLIKTVEK